MKTVVRRKAAFLVVGWVTGSSERVGALLLGAYDSNRDLVYCGAVMSGLSHSAKRELYEKLRALEMSTSPLTHRPDLQAIRHARWVRPQLAGAVEYREFPGQLRHAAWKGLIPTDPATVSLPPRN